MAEGFLKIMDALTGECIFLSPLKDAVIITNWNWLVGSI